MALKQLSPTAEHGGASTPALAPAQLTSLPRSQALPELVSSAFQMLVYSGVACHTSIERASVDHTKQGERDLAPVMSLVHSARS